MAIDFMVMPLSRYLSGDFVTPNMRAAWDMGVPFSIIGPEGPRLMPVDVPYGGIEAPANRARFVPLVRADLASVLDWDEASDAEPAFHRPHAPSYEAFVQHCKSPPARLFGLVKARPIEHAHRSLFFPNDFETSIVLESPFPERRIGSVPRALAELERTKWPDEAEHAVEMLKAALHDAQRLKLPVVVDS